MVMQHLLTMQFLPELVFDLNRQSIILNRENVDDEIFKTPQQYQPCFDGSVDIDHMSLAD